MADYAGPCGIDGVKMAQSESTSLNALGRLLLAPVQAVAIARRAWVGPAEELADAIAVYLPSTSRELIAGHLYDNDLQRELYLRRDVGLWRGQPDGGLRIVDYQPPDDIAHALWFANRAEPGGRACRFCAIQDTDQELIVEQFGTHRTYIHPRCRRAALVWSSWARVGRAEAAKQTPARPRKNQMWWEILGCLPNAKDADIEAAYKRAAAAAHPDRNSGSDEVMQRVNAAREEALGPRTKRAKAQVAKHA